MIIDKLLLIKISTIETFGYLLVFLATLLEASPLVGIFIPGSVIIFFAGFVAKMHFLAFKWVLIFAILGAILGDLWGYLFGRYCGKKFLHRFGKYFLIKREYMDRSGEIVHGHTGKSLVLGRINPITRSVAPFIAGAHKVNFWKFMFFNVIGGILWGFTFVSLGYLLGEGYRVAASFERSIVMITIGLILFYYLWFFIKILLDKVNGNTEN